MQFFFRFSQNDTSISAKNKKKKKNCIFAFAKKDNCLALAKVNISACKGHVFDFLSNDMMKKPSELCDCAESRSRNCAGAVAGT